MILSADAATLTLGARAEEGGAHFRVWAPGRRRVEVDFGNRRPPFVLSPEENGYFTGFAPSLPEGTLYRYRLDEEGPFPDPASRFQPEGPHGPSQLVGRFFPWTDEKWRGLKIHGQVLYELHIGTLTPEGTWAAATRALEGLARVGVTAVEVMPVAEFPGKFGWGYDGVALFAPYHGYGRPEDFKAFIDRAHGLGLGVLLDVVYNHAGPDGNYWMKFSPDYFSKTHNTDWGPALNFDGPGSAEVRRFICENAAYWISEFHIDGLRLDATQNIVDSSKEHLVQELARAARHVAHGREILITAENETQQLEMLRPAGEGGWGVDAIWNDDFHHCAFVALTGWREAYYVDYSGSPQELVSAAKWGTLFQGQWCDWHDAPRGQSSRGLRAAQFINYLDNHDQVSNTRAKGERLSSFCSPARYRAVSALFLLSPQTPLLFQGQERGARTPFCFFADHKEELREPVKNGRREFMARFPSLRGAIDEVEDPSKPRTFSRCVVGDFSEPVTALYRDLLALRKKDEVFSAQDARRLFGAVLGPSSFALRFVGDAGDDRLLLINLGREELIKPQSDPLLAPPHGCRWELLWSSESARYGGMGTPSYDRRRWDLPPESALVFRSLGNSGTHT